MSSESLNVLVSPLDWGLGHASRCIPVIRQLLAEGHKVTIGAYGRSLDLLQQEFPFLERIELQGFSPSYPKSGRMVLHLLSLLPKFLYGMIHEHRKLKNLISLHHFDVVISDNRYGLWNKNVKSILITHQVMIKTPAWMRFGEYPLYLVSRTMIKRFDDCWIPDYAKAPGLSGDLSHKYPLPRNARFTGPLSRFQNTGIPDKKISIESKISAVLSGPEPQRSIFEKIVSQQLTKTNLPSFIIRGKPESAETSIKKHNLTLIAHTNTENFRSLIESSELIICRSGYSSIMDLNALGVKALFVPTPGQTEQIYLAELIQKNGIALSRTQENLNLDVDISEAMRFPGFKKDSDNSGLEAAIKALKKK
jgi:uncharacterized protein (TIGR00661 family)